MSMYKFVKGSRLFMQGTREGGDYDNIHDTFNPTSSPSPRPGHDTTGRIKSRGGGGEGFGSSDDGDLHAVHTMRSIAVNGSTEWDRSSKTVRSGGIKTRSTRTVRKVTTITKGEQSVTSESIMTYGSDHGQKYPALAHDKKNLKFRVIEKVCVSRKMTQILLKVDHLFKAKILIIVIVLQIYLQRI